MKTQTLNVIALHCVVGNENYHRPCVYHIEIMLDKMWLMNNKEQGRGEIVYNTLLRINVYFGIIGK